VILKGYREIEIIVSQNVNRPGTEAPGFGLEVYWLNLLQSQLRDPGFFLPFSTQITGTIYAKAADMNQADACSYRH